MRRFVLVVVTVIFCAAATARASLPERFGFGIRSAAMAGTGTAVSDDYEASYANPAGMAWSTHRRLTVGYIVGRYGVALDGEARSIDGTNGLVLGADLPLPLGGALAGRLAIGFGFYLPTGVVNRARAPFPDRPWLPLLDGDTQTVSVMVCGAVRATEHFSVGGGVLALAALQGAIHLETDAGGHIASRSEQQLVTDFAPIVGARFDPEPRVRLGAVFRGRSQSRYDIRIDNRLSGVVPFDLPQFRISGTSQYDPLQLAVEGAVAPTGAWLLVANLTYKRWSAYPYPNEVATAGTPPPPPPGFHDTVVPRVAVELRRATATMDLRARAGYFFEWSPAPDAAPERTLLDASRHVFTVGGELHFRNRYLPAHLELFFQWHQLQPNSRVHGGFGVGGASVGIEL